VKQEISFDVSHYVVLWKNMFDLWPGSGQPILSIIGRLDPCYYMYRMVKTDFKNLEPFGRNRVDRRTDAVLLTRISLRWLIINTQTVPGHNSLVFFLRKYWTMPFPKIYSNNKLSWRTATPKYTTTCISIKKVTSVCLEL